MVDGYYFMTRLLSATPITTICLTPVSWKSRNDIPRSNSLFPRVSRNGLQTVVFKMLSSSTGGKTLTSRYLHQRAKSLQVVQQPDPQVAKSELEYLVFLPNIPQPARPSINRPPSGHPGQYLRVTSPSGSAVTPVTAPSHSYPKTSMTGVQNILTFPFVQHSSRLATCAGPLT